MSDADYAQQVTQGMRSSIASQITTELAAAVSLAAAAPTPTGRGWDATQDAAAIAAMKASWITARTAYESIEGAVAPLFPEVDVSTDARYDDFLLTLGSAGDPDLFDDMGVTGLHAIERILYADQIPQRVIDFEMTLPGYVPAAFPATEAEATEFKTKLCQKLVSDLTTLQPEWNAAQLDLGGAFQGLISLMNEQHEKVTKAATGEEESRYSQRTLADLRANLDGTRTIYALFSPWITSKSGGGDADTKIKSGFVTLQTAYDADTGDAIPQPPTTWSAEDPSAADLATPFGQLYSIVTTAVDPTRDGSVVSEMNITATLLGYPQFVEGQ